MASLMPLTLGRGVPGCDCSVFCCSEMEWHGSAQGGRMGWLAVALGVSGAGFLPFFPVVSLTLFIAGVACAFFVKVNVTIDASAVRVSGPIGFPRVAFPFSRIAAVTAIEVRPMKVGGWGYRGSLTVFRRAAWVVRGGPGLQLDLRDGRRFVVTVDDAEAAARFVSSRHDVEPE